MNEEHLGDEESKSVPRLVSRSSMVDSFYSRSSDERVSEDDEKSPTVRPFRPGIDRATDRKNFALKKFNDKERSFAERRKRELPKEVLVSFKRTKKEMERKMTRQVKMKVQEIEAENRIVDL